MTLDADNKARLAFAVMMVLIAAGAITWYSIVEAGYTTYQIVTRDPVSGLIADAPIEFHGVDVEVTVFLFGKACETRFGSVPSVDQCPPW